MHMNTLSNVKDTVAFIGGGNMAEAIIAGLLSCGFPPSQLILSAPLRARAEYMRSTFPHILHTHDNCKAVLGDISLPNATAGHCTARPPSVVILAVKPNVIRSVCDGLSKEIQTTKAVVVSVAAGIRTCDIVRWLSSSQTEKGCESTVIRCMPNTPALVQEGATGLYATSSVSEYQRDLTATLLGAVSETVWVEKEEQLDTVTGLSGSGPAYFFLILEAMEEAGVRAGLSREISSKLAVKTCLGAAKMADESPDSFAELRRKVTSPNGTTAAAIDTLTSGGMEQLIGAAVNAARNRGHEMGIEYGKF